MLPIVVPAMEPVAIVEPHPRRAELELEAIQAELVALRRRVARLEAAGLQPARPLRARPAINVLDIMGDYCRALAEEGYAVNGRHLTIADLQSIRRNQSLAHPRQVGMWLCVELVRHATVTQVARAFQKDHTTVMAACKRAAAILDREPRVAAAARAVLARFDVQREPHHG